MASLLFISMFLAFSSSLVPSSPRKMEVGRKEVDNEPVLVLGHSTQSNGFDPSKVVQLSWHPRAFLYTGFLAHEECDHLISLAHGKVEKPMVVDLQSGDSIISPLRTSSGMFLHRGQDDIVKRIEDKISTWTLLPKENGEPLQILHYELNEKYKPHHDYLEEKSRFLGGGQRFASVLIYLSNVTQGGETVLLKSELKDTQRKDETWSPCARASYAVKPVKGNALLFFNLHVNLTKDERSLHGGCPVLDGEKWLASKWIHLRAYNEEEDLQSSGSECTDEDENCPQWAALGECKKNPVYMVGTPDYYGTCRKSCHVC